MPISENQLKTWSHRGAEVTAKATHERIRKTLKRSKHLARPEFKTYLQGSYRNYTNILKESDVDIVCELVSTSYFDISRLTEEEQEEFERNRERTNYGLHDFRQDVISALDAKYPGEIDSSGRRSIKVRKRSGGQAADVVVCAMHRSYKRYESRSNCDYDLGICFWDQLTSAKIVNFPTLHHSNGASKNSAKRTRQNYKPTIRMFKNVRERMASEFLVLRDSVPSYFIECLLYNVPDDRFIGTFQERYRRITEWLVDAFETDGANEFVCQNGQQQLFGQESIHWNTSDAKHFTAMLLEYWENYK